MKPAVTVALVIVVLAVVLAGLYLYNPLKVLLQRSSTSSCNDPDSISSHIYNPNRLQIVDACVSAAGIVDGVFREADGDLHIRLNLDAAYSNLTNSVNDEFQHGDLVVEIICVDQATQTDAIPSCQDYTNHIPIPDAGQHITVTGPYVLDKQHGSWAEIHPVFSLVTSPSPSTVVSITSESLDISYPDGATNGWLGPSSRSYSGWHAMTVNPGEQFASTLSLYSTSSSTEQIESITVSTPGFLTVAVSPSTPIIFTPEGVVVITLTIQSPTSNYYGSIDIQLVAS